MNIESIGILLAAIFTLAIFSFLYRENPVYRFAEHLLVGVSSGYYLVQFCIAAIYRKLYVPIVDDGHWTLLFGGVLGFLMLFRFSRRTEWISRFSLAFYVAAGAGYIIPNVLNAQVLAQVQASFLSPAGSVSSWTTAKEVLIVIGVLAILVYFFFSKPHRGATAVVAKVGIAFLMIGFGASFGYTVMGRVTLLIGRITFLLRDVPAVL